MVRIIGSSILDHLLHEMVKTIVKELVSQAVLQIESDMTMRAVPFGSYDWRKK